MGVCPSGGGSKGPVVREANESLRERASGADAFGLAAGALALVVGWQRRWGLQAAEDARVVVGTWTRR